MYMYISNIYFGTYYIWYLLRYRKDPCYLYLLICFAYILLILLFSPNQHWLVMIKESYILITNKERQKMSPNIKGAVLLLLKNPHQLYVCTHPIYKIPSFDHSNLTYTHSLLNNYYLLILGQGYIIFITSEFRWTFRLLIRHRSFNLYSHQ